MPRLSCSSCSLLVVVPIISIFISCYFQKKSLSFVIHYWKEEILTAEPIYVGGMNEQNRPTLAININQTLPHRKILKVEKFSPFNCKGNG